MADRPEKARFYVLTHELPHIKRFDILSKWLLAAALCVHWFNPLVWVMYILANRDIELSCDETVVLASGETIKSAYALALIGLEEKKSGFSPLFNNFAKNAIEERITAIMKIKRTLLVGILLALVLVVGLATSALAVSAADAQPDNTLLPSLSFNTSNNDTMDTMREIKETQKPQPVLKEVASWSVPLSPISECGRNGVKLMSFALRKLSVIVTSTLWLESTYFTY